MPALLKKYHDRENGFTLIELLIVVLIIGVLAAIAIPVYLGIQQQGYKAAVRSDVNISVKRVQVGLTEGANISDIKANPGSYTQKSVKGENIYVAASTTNGASANDYQLSGVLNTTTTPAGPINYSYTYDSVTGNFTDSSSGLAFGSANPTIAITTGSLANATTGTPYSQTLSAITGSPTSTTVWSISGLPAGLTYNAATGTISGTPTTAGSATVNVTATNGSVNDNRTYTLNVYATPVFTTTSLPAANTSDVYNQTLVASGTPTPTFAVTSGSLPAGLTLTGAVISGTPTATGTATFTVTATNTAGSAAQAFTIVVGAKPAISTTTLPGAAGNVAYSQTIAATGTPAPTFTATGLPSTLTIDPNTGTISGTPTAGGTYNNVVVTATNTSGTASQTYTLTVATPPATPTGTVAIQRFTDEGGSRVSFHNYMWATSATCATGQLQYYFVDSTGGNKGSTFWQTWSNFEIGNPYAVGTNNTWTVKERCADTSTGAVSTEVVAPARSFTSMPTTSNLLTNASFENGNTSSWGVGAGSFTTGPSATSGAVDGGTGSYIASGTTGSSGASFEQDLYASQPAGKNFYGSIWIRSTSGSGGANICVWNISSGQNNCVSYPVSSTWTQVTTNYTLTSSASQVRLEVYLGGNTTYQFDDASLKATN